MFSIRFVHGHLIKLCRFPSSMKPLARGRFSIDSLIFCIAYSTIAIRKIYFIHSPYKRKPEIANIRTATTEIANSYCRHYSTAISQSKLPSRKEAIGMICGAVTAPWQLNEQTRMKIPLPGRSAAFRAPTGSNATQITGAVKDLEDCKKNGAVLASTEFGYPNSLAGIVSASIAPATAGAACTRHYLYKQRIVGTQSSLSGV